MDDGKTALRHMIQLDGFRAFAVMAVVYSHFGSQNSPLVRSLPWGPIGVRFFFVLSGFLITGILLKCRELKSAAQASGGQLLGRFYIRRFLRIFPLYYVVLLIITAANIRPSRELFWWHLTYTSNVHYALEGSFNGPGSHFWSLAVEEQFYLVWPWLILFAPQRWLMKMVVGTISLAVAFRGFGTCVGWNDVALQILPFGCLDALGFGSLLALLSARHGLYSGPVSRMATISFWVGISVMLLLLLAKLIPLSGKLYSVFQDLEMALVFVAFVAWGARGIGGPVGRFLSWRPVVYLGKISYGIYVWHGFAPVVLPRVFSPLGLSNFYLHFEGVLNTLASIALAAISWHLFEGPINRLKDRFPYVDRRAAGQSDPVVSSPRPA